MKEIKISDLNKFGKDVFISPFVSIMRPELINIGNHVAIDPFLHCTTRLEIGDYVHISSHVSIIGGEKGLLRMGNFTNISVGGRIITGSDEFKGVGIVSVPGIPEKFRDKLIIEPVVFEDFVNICTQVTILPGVTLPQGVVIGACSLVRKEDKLFPWTIYAGSPLQEIKTRPSEQMLKFARELGY